MVRVSRGCKECKMKGKGRLVPSYSTIQCFLTKAPIGWRKLLGCALACWHQLQAGVRLDFMSFNKHICKMGQRMFTSNYFWKNHTWPSLFLALYSGTISGRVPYKRLSKYPLTWSKCEEPERVEVGGGQLFQSRPDGGCRAQANRIYTRPPNIFRIRELGDNGGGCQKEFISEVELGE